MFSPNLLHDDLGDLDSLMQQMNTASAAPAATLSVAAPSPLAVTQSLASPSWNPSSTNSGVQRVGRRGTIQLVMPSSQAPPETPLSTGEPEGQRSASEGSSTRPASATSHSGDVKNTPTVSNEVELDWMTFTVPERDRSALSSTTKTEISSSVEPSSRLPAFLPTEDDEGTKLRRQEMELLAEIEAFQAQIDSAEHHLRAETLKGEAELLELDTKRLLKDSESADAVIECQRKIEEALKGHAERSRVLQQKISSELHEIETVYRSQSSLRLDRIRHTMKTNVEDTDRALQGLRQQRDLLTTDNSIKFTEGAIVSRVATQNTLTDKLQVGALVVADFVQSRLDSLRNCIVDFIHTETMSEASATWENHRLTSAKDRTMRRDKLVHFLEASVERFTSFVTHRRDKRTAELTEFREVVTKMSNAMRQKSAERLTQRQEEASRLHTEVSAAFQHQVDSTMKFVTERASLVSHSDDDVGEHQEADIRQRLEVELRVHRNLFEGETEAYQSRLSKLYQDVEPAADVATTEQKNLLENATSSVKSMMDRIQAMLQSVTNCATNTHQVTKLMMFGEGSRVAESTLPEAERSLRMLLREKQGVVEELQAEVRAQWNSLNEARKRCEDIRGRLLTSFEDEAAVVHEQRSLLHAHKARVELLSCSWEGEHRAMLGATVAEGPLQGLLTVAQQLLAASLFVSERSAGQRKTLSIQQKVTQREEEERNVAMHTLQSHWTALYERLMSIIEKTQQLSFQQTQIGVEEAKLCFERMTHDAQRVEFTEKAQDLSRRAGMIQQGSMNALIVKERATQELQTIEEEQQRIAAEQRKLTILQSELLERQHEAFASERQTLRCGPTTRNSRPRVSPFADLIAAHS